MASGRLRILISAALALATCAALAQAPAAPARAPAAVPLDRVLVVVNDAAITQWDLTEQIRN